MVESAQHLEWLSRKLSKHHIYGTHASKQVGQGLEFEQYRPYIQGDDLRQLDWKLYAKTGKYYINCLLYTSPSPRDRTRARMPSSA